MTVITPNSISGINSITAQSGTLEFYNASGSIMSVTGNVTGNINSTGVSTFSGGITVGVGGTIITTDIINGRIGLGKTNPVVTLDVSGPGSPLVVDSSNSNTYKIALRSAGIQTTFIGSNSSNLFEVADSSVTSMLQLTTLGYLRIPNQPAFHAQGTGTLAVSGSQADRKLTIASNIAPNTSNSYSSSRFTAPVSGNYLFYLSTTTTTATSTGPAILLYKNGSGTQEIALNYTNASYSQFGGSIIRSAVQGDYFEFYLSNYNSTSFTIDLSRTYFGGYLIG